MIRFLVVGFLLCAIPSLGQVLWLEDFEGEANGAQTGTAGGTIGGNWTATYGGAGTFSKENILGTNLFQVTDTDTEGVWTMDAPISIAGTGRAIVEMSVIGALVQAGDYFRAYYKVDGGPEILFFEQTGGLLSFTLTGTAIVSGSILEVVVRATTNGDFFGIDTFTMDDVRITGVNTLYSRKSSTWDDVTPGNSTWSIVSIGGASCNCAPLTTDYVIVGGGFTVDINVAATAGGVEVQNTGTLRYSVNTVDLNIDRGILQVDAGGTINQNARTGVQIDFDRGIINTFINNGTITTESIEVTAANATVNITGAGSIVLTQDFNILGDDIVVDNDLNGTFTIGDDLVFDQTGDILSDDAQFINRRTVTITSDIVVGANNDDDNIVTNAAGAVLNVSGINPNGADFDVLNSGTINQSGNFSNIDAADTNLDNLATGIWNWTFVQAAFDTDLNTVLNCTAVGNTFNYGAAGNQSMVAVSYDNLTNSGSGIKVPTADLTILGNLLIAGTAQLNPNTGNFNITLSGNWTVTSTNANPFDEGTETVILAGTTTQQTISTVLAAGETFAILETDNTFPTSPQFVLSSNVTVSTTLTMTTGNINLNGRTFIITPTGAAALSHGLTSANGWMYGGSLRRGTVNTGIGVGTIRGFFPMGSATDFRPFYFGKPGGTTAGTTTVTHDATLSSTSIVSFADDLTITRRHDSFWTIVTTCTGGAAAWSLQGGGTGFGTIANITHLRLSTSVGITGTPGVNSGTIVEPIVQRTGISIANINANNFHVASVDAVNSPLPITLTSFTAFVEGDRVRLDWVTESELNNDYFTLERTSDAERFESLTQVKGKGTTTQQSKYSHVDADPIPGVSYYRLKQTDFDGTFTYSELIKVVNDSRKPRITAFPNPATNKVTTLDIRGLAPGEEMQVMITDLRGSQTFSGVYQANGSGSVSVVVDLAMASTGMYVVRLLSSSLLTQTKLVVE